jgi:hypothetical protein
MATWDPRAIADRPVPVAEYRRRVAAWEADPQNDDLWNAVSDCHGHIDHGQED